MKPMQYLLNFVASSQVKPVSGYQISAYFRTVLHLSGRSAGATIARAVQYGHISIVGTITINSRLYNLYQ